MDSDESPGGASPYEQSPPDLQQWMDTVWTQVFGFPARSTDALVVRQISEERFESRVDAIADLLWDHWMGGTRGPSVEQVRQFVVDVSRELTEAANQEPEGS